MTITDDTPQDDSPNPFSDDDIATFMEFKAFKTQMENSTRLDSKSFGELTGDGRKAWAKLTSKDKATILAATQESGNSSSRQAFVTEIDAAEEEDDESTNNGDSKTSEVNETKTSTSTAAKDGAHPGNINRVLSKSASKKPASKSTTSTARKANTVQWVVNSLSRTETTQTDTSRNLQSQADAHERYRRENAERIMDATDHIKTLHQAKESDPDSDHDTDSDDDSIPILDDRSIADSSVDEDSDGEEWGAYNAAIQRGWDEDSYDDHAEDQFFC
jgi:hypothetical protein